MPECSGLTTKAGKIAFGTQSVIYEIENKKAKLIIIAKDASDRTKFNFKKLCEEYNINYREILSIEEISNSIGKNNKAVIAIKDVNFSNEILKIIDGGEIIG